MPLLEPRLNSIEGFPEWPKAWRLGLIGEKRSMSLFQSKRDLAFACREDCERAVQAFEDEGFTTVEQLAALGDTQRAMIATRYLRW